MNAVAGPGNAPLTARVFIFDHGPWQSGRRVMLVARIFYPCVRA